MKDSFYFPHDYNAHQDPKCSALIKDFGFAGYGLYWVMVELLHEQGGKIKKFPKLIDGLAHQLRVEKEYMVKLLEALLQDYNLFQQDDTCIWSERVIKNIHQRREKYIKKSEAGRIGGLRSGITRKLKQNEAVLEANEPKEIKGKEMHHATHDLSLVTVSKTTGFNKGLELNFEDIWSRYPNRVDKKAAFRHFKASVKNEKDLDDINMALNNYLQTKSVLSGYIKNGSTWFNNWRDYIDYKDPVSPQMEQQELIRKAGLDDDSTNSRGAYLREQCQG